MTHDTSQQRTYTIYLQYTTQVRVYTPNTTGERERGSIFHLLQGRLHDALGRAGQVRDPHGAFLGNYTRRERVACLFVRKGL